MADGEYHFLLGASFNKNHPKLFRSSIAFLLSKLQEFIVGPSIKNSWGETYTAQEVKKIKADYEAKLKKLTEGGILCPFIYENPIDSYTHYNKKAIRYLVRINAFGNHNYYPFHFPMLMLSNPGWEIFIQNRRILVVTGNLAEKRDKIDQTLTELGASVVGFYEISANKAMTDKLNKKNLKNGEKYELVFVAAGIGSLNIISQLDWFKGPVIDIGGLIKVFYEHDFIYHGGAVKYPVKL
jgi:hypothetical protein